MGWKELPLWLRVGIILFFISLSLEIVDYTAGSIICSNVSGTSLTVVETNTAQIPNTCVLPTKIIEVLVPFRLASLFDISVIHIVITSIFYFFIGALIGVIITKIKTKRDS